MLKRLAFALVTLFAVNAAATPAKLVSPLQRTEVFGEFTLPFGAFGAAPGFTFGADTPVGNDPVYKYLRLGGLFQANFFTGGNGAMLDFDALVRPQYAIPVGYGHLAVYVKVPLGITVRATSIAAGFGFNFGIIPGVRYFIDEHWGFLAEFGFAYHGIVTAIGPANLPAGVFSIGAAYAF
jgi:hypothetical protein